MVQGSLHTQALINIADVVIMKDALGRWIEANEQAVRLLQLDSIDFRNRTNSELARLVPVHAKSLENGQVTDEQAWRSQVPIHTEETIVDSSGVRSIFQVTKVPLLGVNGGPDHLLITGRNITAEIQSRVERVESELRIEMQQKALMNVIKSKQFNSSDPVASSKFITETVAHTLTVSEVSIWLVTNGGDELECRDRYSLSTGTHLPVTHRIPIECAHNGELRIRTEKNLNQVCLQGIGGSRAWSDSGSSVIDAQIYFNGKTIGILRIVEIGRLRIWTKDEETFASSVADMVALNLERYERLKVQKQLDHMAYHDPLTQLLNRKGFEEQLKDMLQEAIRNDPLAVIHLNLDRFTFVNDTFGHTVGDALLLVVANELLLTLRDGDTVARTSGDEFSFICKVASFEDARKICDRILSVFESPFEVNKQSFYMGASIGVSLYPDHGEDYHKLMKHADKALHLSKGQGKNQFTIFTESMNDRSMREFALHNDLYSALDNQQLVVYYQPRVHPQTGEIVASEALLRWQHPRFGQISPLEFIPVAEESDLINPIGKWVIESVCRQQMSWMQSGLNPRPVSINVSGRQIVKLDFISSLFDILDHTKVSGNLIEIELTEGTAFQSEEIVIESIAQMKKVGIKVAVDDFGTGYSSLGRLKQFNFDMIKIDKSFIRDLEVNQHSRTITKALIQLAHGLGMRVIAEGVETNVHLSFLQELACDEAQGYLFCKPVSAEQFGQLLRVGWLHSQTVH